jgi:hypothetical protein
VKIFYQITTHNGGSHNLNKSYLIENNKKKSLVKPSYFKVTPSLVKDFCVPTSRIEVQFERFRVPDIFFATSSLVQQSLSSPVYHKNKERKETES